MPTYTPSGNPATGSEGLSALIRGEFNAIAAAFAQTPQITTTGVFTTVFNQQGNFTFTLPAAPGTFALSSDVATAVSNETSRATAAEAANAAASTANATAISAETTRATAAEALKSPLANPTFTGTVTVPTPATLDSSTKAVNSVWVANFLAASGFAPTGASPVTSVAGRTGNVVLTHSDISGLTHTDITDWNATIASALAPYALINSIPPLLGGQLSGLSLSNDVATPNTVLDIAAGSATDSTNVSVITLPSAISKSIAGPWSAGNAAGGMGTGLTAAAGTWLHVYAATISGATDVFFDTAFPPTHSPSGTTASRRVGSVRLSGSTQIVPFIQSGDNFQWITTRLDVANATLPTVARTLFSVSGPIGVRTTVLFRAQGICAANNLAVDFTSPDVSDEAIAAAADLTASVNSLNGGTYSVRTDTSGQIGIKALNVGTSLSIKTIGFTDTRGQS